MKKPIIGISIGDINGIGPEVILKTFSDERILEICTPVIYASAKVISYHKNIVKLDDLKIHQVKEASQAVEGAINVVNCWNENVDITLGETTEEGGRYAQISLDNAVMEALSGSIDALVTAPINKKAMQLSGFKYPGHTEFIAHKAGAKNSLMFMVGEQLRIGIVTGHIPLNEVAAKITKEAILKKIQLMHESLVKDFGIDTPKIAVLGLNPHASDNGAIGEEETNQIIPAIAAARAKRMFVFGPYAADGFFGAGSFAKYDGIIAMFHDQGLTPFKTLEFHGGVNFTAGLSIVRTSPDHGTGFDIAGQDIASPDSFRQAVFMAIDIVRHRRNYAEMTANPLRQQEIADIKRGLEEGGDDGVIREQKSYQ